MSIELTDEEWKGIQSKTDRDFETGDCVLWQGARHKENTVQRHGTVLFRGKWWLVHRLMYAAFRGAIPEGMCVLHACNPTVHRGSCVQPTHLYIGTKKQNALDMLRYGTIKSPSTVKMNYKKAAQMRKLKKEGASLSQLAKMFGVNKGQAGKICRNEQWVE